jgi:maltooligosyltrehalose trehalohydrolase
VGAEVCGSTVSFRVWAPARRTVTLVIGTDAMHEVALHREAEGYFCVSTAEARAGSQYRFRLDDDPYQYPDPASRFQPRGPHGPSQVVDPRDFRWSDASWPGLTLKGQVLYELHIGTFTNGGTWATAAEKLPELAELGVTAVEVMPVAEFSGEFGWGYDGVGLFAPTRLYGVPDDFRRFVDRAHSLGLGVVLDVVYNHLGPNGNYLPAFSPFVFSDQYQNEWGEALNYDGEHSGPVREFMQANAAYWISEFHIDGLRLDATHTIHDASQPHILAEITRVARTAAGGRTVLIFAENESQRIEHLESPESGGYGMDALWNDDLHHTAVVALTGRHEAYYSDYRGSPQEFISAAKWGYLYQGQWYDWQQQGRGTPALGIDPEHFVTFLENHDQVANTGLGVRLHQLTSPAAWRALTACLLLGPGTPLLFQGQEFASSRPFRYFADHEPDLARQVRDGRREFMKQFPSVASPAMQGLLPDPADRETYEDCKLDWSERVRHHEVLALHRDLLALRRNDPVLSRQSGRLDGAVLAAEAFVLRFFADDGGDRLLLTNLGQDLELHPVPEPLVAAPRGYGWALAWSSEDPRYGGSGMPEFNWTGRWRLPGRSALFLTSRQRPDR